MDAVPGHERKCSRLAAARPPARSGLAGLVGKAGGGEGRGLGQPSRTASRAAKHGATRSPSPACPRAPRIARSSAVRLEGLTGPGVAVPRVTSTAVIALQVAKCRRDGGSPLSPAGHPYSADVSRVANRTNRARDRRDDGERRCSELRLSG